MSGQNSTVQSQKTSAKKKFEERVTQHENIAIETKIPDSNLASRMASRRGTLAQLFDEENQKQPVSSAAVSNEYTKKRTNENQFFTYKPDRRNSSPGEEAKVNRTLGSNRRGSSPITTSWPGTKQEIATRQEARQEAQEIVDEIERGQSRRTSTTSSLLDAAAQKLSAEHNGETDEFMAQRRNAAEARFINGILYDKKIENFAAGNFEGWTNFGPQPNSNTKSHLWKRDGELQFVDEGKVPFSATNSVASSIASSPARSGTRTPAVVDGSRINIPNNVRVTRRNTLEPALPNDVRPNDVPPSNSLFSRLGDFSFKKFLSAKLIAAAIMIAVLVGVGIGMRNAIFSSAIGVVSRDAFTRACRIWTLTPGQHKDTSSIEQLLSSLPVQQRNDLAWDILFAMLFAINCKQNRREAANMASGNAQNSLRANMILNLLKATLTKRLSGSVDFIDKLKSMQPKDLLQLSAEIGEIALTADVTSWYAATNTLRQRSPAASIFSHNDLLNVMIILRQRFNSCVLHLMVADTLDDNEAADVLPTLTEFRSSSDLATVVQPDLFRKALRSFFDAASESEPFVPTDSVFLKDAVFSRVSDQIVSMF